MTDPKDRSAQSTDDTEVASVHKASSRISVPIDTSEPEWGDPICSCEAEPYWLEVAEEQEREEEEKDS